MQLRDPATMTPSERLAEIGAILLVGYRRLRDRQPDLDSSLAASLEDEPSCGYAVDDREQEVA
jgi:hypothetical protein